MNHDTQELNSKNAKIAPLTDRKYNLRIALLILVVTACWAVWNYFRPYHYYYRNLMFGKPPGPQRKLEDGITDNIPLRDPWDDPLPAIRTEFGGSGTFVYGWPSSGGVWVHESCYGIELDFLGVSRFEPSETERSSDPEKEDEFCERLKWIGAHFYKSECEYNKQEFKSGNEDLKFWYGWPGAIPSDGVWALWTKDFAGAEMGVGRIRNALTMQERCKAIEMLGGKFYARWEDVIEGESRRLKMSES